MEDYRTWEFNKSISIEEVADFVARLNYIGNNESITFDLTRTVNIHSSFIGFLIHAKHHINKNGGKLVLLLSLTVEKILIMLNILEYFSSDIVSTVKQKTA